MEMQRSNPAFSRIARPLTASVANPRLDASLPPPTASSDSILNQAPGQVSKTDDALPREPVADDSIWKADIYANPFVPDAFLAINESSAIPVTSAPLEGVNFPRYIQSFASAYLLSPVGELHQLPSFSGKWTVRSTEEFKSENYGAHLSDCMALDLKAQLPEVRRYDLFGVLLAPTGPVPGVYSVNVPGIREGMPQIALGDDVLVRQLLLDPRTGLPRYTSEWLADGGCATGIPAPGFTGYQVSAVVLAIDRKWEAVIIRADGLVPKGELTCNVSFTVSTRLLNAVYRATSNIARELSGHPSHVSTSTSNRAWLQRMLFPLEADGELQTALPVGVFAQEWFDQSLNYEQKKAVNAIQRRKHRTPFLVHGPPGTGKTKTICEAVTQLANDQTFKASILLCAPSDQAADTLIMRLRHQFKPRALFRLNDFSRTFAEVPQEILHYCYIENDFFSLPPFPALMIYKIVVATCRSADMLVQARVTNRDLLSFQGGMTVMIHPYLEQAAVEAVTPFHWGALLVDEAAQATEPETLVSLAVVTPRSDPASSISDSSKKQGSNRQDPIFVMTGDQHQLSPRTYDKSTTLHISLFERLSNRPLYAAHPLAGKTRSLFKPSLPMIRPPFVNLTRNYRSHPAILAVPSSLFYANTLIPEAAQTDSLLTWHQWCGRRWPVFFACNGGIDTCQDLRAPGGGAGWYNVREARKAIAYAQDLLESGIIIHQPDICIMSPFRAQVALLRNIARDLGLWGLNIGPTEAFQGLESRFVIICTTRARRRFLEPDRVRGMGIVGDEKKFNVAVTRAKEGLVVLGNPWVLATDPCWMAFLRFCWRNGLWQGDTEEEDGHGRMIEGEESRVNEWAPPGGQDTQGGVSGLEAALIYKEEQGAWKGSSAVQRFMGESWEDAVYRSGLEAEDAVAEYQGEGEGYRGGGEGEGCGDEGVDDLDAQFNQLIAR